MTNGYSISSPWVNTANLTYWYCLDATSNAAVWTNLTAGATAGIVDTAFSSGANGDTTHAPSRNAWYDYAHTGDTDDDGLADKLDLSSAGFVRTTSGGVISSAELSGDATTSGSAAVTVTKINGTSLGGLATGPLYNTTSTGVPSIATAAQLGTAISTAAFDGRSVTNMAYDAPTNTFTINSAFPVGQTNQVLSAGSVTGGVTGIANGPTSGDRWGTLEIVSTGTLVFTNPVSIHASDYLTTRTITNGNTAIISFQVTTGRWTNMAIVQFK